jgi:ArsR family transcriptional regulator
MTAIGDYLRLLADETRLRVLHLLEIEPLTVAEFQEVLDLGQSSISGHLAKLKQAGLIHDLAEGSARRYRMREDADQRLRSSWASVREVSRLEPQFISDRERLERHLRTRGSSWIERVAGSLHREYAPGRTWESLCHGLLAFADFGRCLDIGAGDGAMAGLLAPHAAGLTCVDPSPAMVAAGRERTRGQQVRWLLAAAERLPLADGCMDAVLFLQSLQYVADPPVALAEAARVLAPGGRLLVVTLARHDFPEAERYGHRHRGFTNDELKRWCRGLTGTTLYALPAETRLPRFQTVVLGARKEAGDARESGEKPAGAKDSTRAKGRTSRSP